jgi:aromatic-L-amino-acid decarboxylase
MSDPARVPHLTPDEFRALGRKVVDQIADYMERVESLPVLSRAKPGQIAAALPEHPPERGLGPDGWDEVFGDLEQIILPGLTHWQSPHFFAFFPCNASGPAILGEFLSAGLNVNGMLWATSPAATELEIRTLDWLAEMIGLPESFRSTGAGGGVIQGTASESTLVAMVAARGMALRAISSPPRSQTPEHGPEGRAMLVAYASTQAHSSVVKAAMVAGLALGPEDRRNVRLIETDATHAMRPDLLAAAIREDRAAGRTPFFVCATVGTTSSTAVDPLRTIGDVLDEAGDPPIWLHVDAAHAGCACVCPEMRWLLDGVERADSLCFNPHKWLLTNFDCDCFYVRDRRPLLEALSVTPEYLRNAASEAGAVVDYRDWGVPLGRRFRALKLWLVIRHYGVEGLRAYIREHLRLAALFESLIREDPRFEICAPRTVNLVCFRLTGDGPSGDARNRALLDRLNASGRLYLTHTTLRPAGGPERVVLRMAIGAATTQERHVREAWAHIRAAADSLPR